MGDICRRFHRRGFPLLLSPMGLPCSSSASACVSFEAVLFSVDHSTSGTAPFLVLLLYAYASVEGHNPSERTNHLHRNHRRATHRVLEYRDDAFDYAAQILSWFARTDLRIGEVSSSVGLVSKVQRRARRLFLLGGRLRERPDRVGTFRFRRVSASSESFASRNGEDRLCDA